MRLAAVLLIAVAAPALSAPTAPSEPTPPKPKLQSARRWACFYGDQLSERAWRSLDLAVVDPDGFRLPNATGPVTAAYLSVGEADERRSWWEAVKGKPFVIEPNPEWPGAHRVDIRSKQWRARLDQSVDEALKKGYQGLFLDTVDVAGYLESSAPARYAGSVEAAAEWILSLRRRRPEAVLLLNNGLFLLDRVAGAIDGLVVEDLYTRCRGDACGPTPEEEARTKEDRLARFARETGKPVYVLHYAPLSRRSEAWVRKAVARARRAGFRSYLAAPSLERLGLVDP